MAGAKEIRTKITSVRSTQKITKAMEMVAASKMRKMQARMRASRPYAEKMRQVIEHVAYAVPEYKHSFLVKPHKVKEIGVIVVSSDRGLCGGLNNNLFRVVVRDIRNRQKQGVGVSYCVIGQKGLGFFRRVGGQIRAQVTHLGDPPHIQQLIGSVKVMLDAYHQGEIDGIFIAYNLFVNTMVYRPIMEQLVPIEGRIDDAPSRLYDYIYEPSPQALLDVLFDRYIESLVYQSVVENAACEQAARMVAMKSANDNAAELIRELQLIYNKARQAAITQEIAEIVGGAAAI
ncbi:MAG: F0F1 ATP synthase subunit gamma [Pseudomonadota bacterium]